MQGNLPDNINKMDFICDLLDLLVKIVHSFPILNHMNISGSQNYLLIFGEPPN